MTATDPDPDWQPGEAEEDVDDIPPDKVPTPAA
jgi:hypothetical protein